jgi:ABC-type polysaccharide/polyol phosphate export permease
MSWIYNFLIFPFTEFYKYRELILYQLRAEFKEKHFQKALGPLWWFGEPFFIALTMIFLTEILFRRTFEENGFIIIIMSVLVWRWFSRSVDSSPYLLVNFQRELGNTNFPILPLVYTKILVEMVFFGFGLGIIFGIALLSGVTLTVNLIYLPIIMIIQLTFIIGLVTIFGKLGIFFKDLQMLIWPVISIWFYLSPGIYPETMIPDQYRWVYDLNPFATIFPAWRNVIVDGVQPDLMNLGIWFLVFLPIALFGVRDIVRSRGEYYKRL